MHPFFFASERASTPIHLLAAHPEQPQCTASQPQFSWSTNAVNFSSRQNHKEFYATRSRFGHCLWQTQLESFWALESRARSSAYNCKNVEMLAKEITTCCHEKSHSPHKRSQTPTAKPRKKRQSCHRWHSCSTQRTSNRMHQSGNIQLPSDLGRVT